MEGAGERRRAGIRRGLPFGIAVFAISISFGVLARPVMGPVAPIVMSILVFSGAAQFGALAVLLAGGSTGAAIAAGVLLNARYLAMGLALAPSLRGNALSRGAFAMPLVDASWAAASRGDGTFDPWYMVGVSIPQYAGWVLGTFIDRFGFHAEAARARRLGRRGCRRNWHGQCGHQRQQCSGGLPDSEGYRSGFPSRGSRVDRGGGNGRLERAL